MTNDLVARLGRLAAGPDAETAIAEVYAPGAVWTGSAPMGTHVGVEAISSFQSTFAASFADATREPLRATWHVEDGVDVLTVLGAWTATMRQPWRGIPASGGRHTLRSLEVHRVVEDRVVDTVWMLDLLDLAVRRGVADPRLTARSNGPWPAPRIAPEGDGASSADIVGTWLSEVADPGDDLELLRGARHLARLSEDFRWHGPSVLGSFAGGLGFVAGQQHPFRRSFGVRRAGSSVSSFRRIMHGAQGSTVVSGAWPAVVCRHTGSDWLGIPATGREVALRVVDVYSVADGRIGENWVMIDMVDALSQLGVETGFIAPC